VSAASLSSQAVIEASTPVDARTREVLLHVSNLHCRACVRRLEQLLGREAQVSVDLPTGTCELRWQPGEADLPALLDKMRAADMEPRLLAADADFACAQKEHRQALIRIGLAALFGMQAMMLASPEYFGTVDPGLRELLRYAQWVLVTPVLLIAGWPMLRTGLHALWQRSATMDTPVAVALVLAYSLSAWNTIQGAGHVYFDSVAMFVLLLSVARFWQQRGQLAAADRLRRLSAAQPATARRIREGRLEEVGASELLSGDIVEVAPGEALPADGTVLSAVDLDESLLSGESLPQHKPVGAKGLAGSTHLGLEPLRLQVELSGEATTLSQIGRLVQRAHLERHEAAHLADRIAGYIVPVVLLLAILAFALWWPDTETGIQAALAVLVITCPCALSLAVPTTLAAAVTRLGKVGVLLVRPSVLLHWHRLREVVFDKTGTLTTRQMQLHRCEVLADLGEEQARRWAAALESGLSHPVARALANAAPELSGLPRVDQRQLTGRGVRGWIDDHVVEVGPLEAVQSSELDTQWRWFGLWVDGQLKARLALNEQLRAEAPAVVQALREQGLQPHMLSGDQAAATQAVAARLLIAKVTAGSLPEQKLSAVKRLQQQGHGVLYVGDGLNDGPVLAGADVAVSLGSGAALAQGQGDALLLSDDLRGLEQLAHTAKLARRISTQNLLWALAYNLTMVPLAMLGWVAPWIAALGMGASSLLVTLNALRLLRQPDLSSQTPATQECLA
jgi:Cu2+-exporting ATPase